MSKSNDDFSENFEKLAKEIEALNKNVEKIIPRAIIRNSKVFGNSSHVVLSKELADKKVGVIVLGDSE